MCRDQCPEGPEGIGLDTFSFHPPTQWEGREVTSGEGSRVISTSILQGLAVLKQVRISFQSRLPSPIVPRDPPEGRVKWRWSRCVENNAQREGEMLMTVVCTLVSAYGSALCNVVC